jgi:hypothetical protein
VVTMVVCTSLSMIREDVAAVLGVFAAGGTAAVVVDVVDAVVQPL